MAEEVVGRIKAAEVALEKVDYINAYLKVGEEIEAKVISINHKDRLIGLSIRARLKDYESTNKHKEGGTASANSAFNSKLGDLLKQHIAGTSTEEEKTEMREEG